MLRGNFKLTLHDVVSVGDETDTDSQSSHSNLPKGNLSFGGGGSGSGPGGIHGSPDTHSVTDIVGTVGERSSACSDDLNERVQVFDFIGVLGGMCVDTVHTATFWGTHDTDLRLVDIVVKTIKTSNNRICGETSEKSNHVVFLVDGTSSGGVVVQSAHSPADRTTRLAEISMVTLEGSSELSLVDGLGVDGDGILLLSEGLCGAMGGLRGRSNSVYFGAVLLSQFIVRVHLGDALVG